MVRQDAVIVLVKPERVYGLLRYERAGQPLVIE